MSVSPPGGSLPYHAAPCRSKIVSTPVPLDRLGRLAAEQFGDFVKAVVDVRQGVMVIGGELHADEEAVLLQHGARPTDLWGIG